MTVDAVHSYTALRSIGVQGDRFVLNGRPYPLRMVLDQGYWPESGLTAPDDDALRRDVELAKAMGFNGVRKHQKIEDPRYLYWADALGLLVWEEMPSAYRFTRESIERLRRVAGSHGARYRATRASSPGCRSTRSLGRSRSCPTALRSVITCRRYTISLRLWTPTRPVIGNDGWESVATDIIGIHDYDDGPERIGDAIRHR